MIPFREGLVQNWQVSELSNVECERVVHETIVAATVMLGVINQLLLREGHQTLGSPALAEAM